MHWQNGSTGRNLNDKPIGLLLTGTLQALSVELQDRAIKEVAAL
jgi:hypothetical protein